MQITSWRQLSAFAGQWGDPQLSRFLRSECRVALNPKDGTDPVAMYRDTSYFPGLLQIQNYVKALCIGEGMSQTWTNGNMALRLARQRLMKGNRQRFLVDETALTFAPGGFREVIGHQLRYALDLLHGDFGRGNRFDFRVVPSPNAAVLPRSVSADTFMLFQTGDELDGFVEPWRSGTLRAVGEGELDLLRYSWSQIGALALGRADSLDLLQQKLREA